MVHLIPLLPHADCGWCIDEHYRLCVCGGEAHPRVGLLKILNLRVSGSQTTFVK